MASTVDHESLSQMAYQLWLDRGQPLGSPEIDWNLAVKLSEPQRRAVNEHAVPEHAVTTAADGQQTPSRDSAMSSRSHANVPILTDEGTEVPMEVPPSTPTPIDVPPTKAGVRRASAGKTIPRLSKA